MNTNLLQLKLIPPVVALLLSFLVIFPDIVWTYSHSSEDQTPQKEHPIPEEFEHREPNQDFHRPEGVPQMPQKEGQDSNFGERKEPHGPQINSVERMAKEFFLFFIITYIFIQMDLFLFDKKRFLKIPSGQLCLHVLVINLLLSTLIAIIYTSFFRQGRTWPIDGLLFFKFFFMAIISYLIVYLLKSVIRQQKISLENERLKTQNIEVQYESLTTQLNPHFFFNSMNSLSYLIRGNQREKSLKYLQKLSEMFRYVLSASKRTVVTLRDEMEMLEAYRYMMEIRFEDKFIFEVDVDEKYYSYFLPVLTVQPLIENVIKHNEISEERPLKVYIKIDKGQKLTVSNTIQPKLLKEESTGIGLRNLNERYKLLFGAQISISNENNTFAVSIPLFSEIDKDL
ncbi:MAG: putative regulator of cell autolysis [Bacteroidetes bacterium]|nr:putative regulator of cell autolysis [Bacteroidota bacterium]